MQAPKNSEAFLLRLHGYEEDGLSHVHITNLGGLDILQANIYSLNAKKLYDGLPDRPCALIKEYRLDVHDLVGKIVLLPACEIPSFTSFTHFTRPRTLSACDRATAANRQSHRPSDAEPADCPRSGGPLLPSSGRACSHGARDAPTRRGWLPNAPRCAYRTARQG
eukprot:gnl/MRDRNA2_/MRDRNA2_84481_c0_seq2.p2 gnl/MRDRNA2_/MRDRNA2_84481_c0~~gnl/MRDRNA2_/MRDRNA2_84481_c0_seq2.p2  ORF type:complete len:165 (-),score=6.43 gnl/MRDRNA2_/MRDRNA2_84481_c0_seq2:238-732(-)